MNFLYLFGCRAETGQILNQVQNDGSFLDFADELLLGNIINVINRFYADRVLI